MKNITMNNHFFNALKGLSCLGVVFIHARFPGVFGELVSAYARTGVAIFFMISGYYSYYDNDSIALEKMKHRFIKNGKLALFSFSIYIIWGVFVRFVGTGIESVKNWIFAFSLKDWFDAIVFNKDIVIGHLWFLLALLYCYLLMILIIKSKKVKLFYAVSTVCLITAILVYEIATLNGVGIPLLYFRNVWLYGMPVFLLGHFVHSRKNELLKQSNLSLIIIFLIGVLLCSAERIFIGNLQFYMGNLIMLVSLFLLGVKNPGIGKNSFLTQVGEKFSLDIYIFHWMVIDIFIKISEIIGCKESVVYNWLNPIIVFFFTLVLSYALYIFKKLCLKYKR